MENMTVTDIHNHILGNNIKQWQAFCDCKEHNAMDSVFISTMSLAQVSFLIQADPFTNKGVKRVNHEIMRRVIKKA